MPDCLRPQDLTAIRHLVTSSVTTLLKNSLSFDIQLQIQGLVGVTIDKSNVFIIHLDEVYPNRTVPPSTLVEVRGDIDEEEDEEKIKPKKYKKVKREDDLSENAFQYIDGNGHDLNVEVVGFGRDGDVESQWDAVTDTDYDASHIGSGSTPRYFACSYCERSYTTPQLLHDHEMIHNGKSPFRCSICSRVCLSQSNLRRHEMSHTNALNGHRWSCAECGKKFKRLHFLEQHRLMFHADSTNEQSCGIDTVRGVLDENVENDDCETVTGDGEPDAQDAQNEGTTTLSVAATVPMQLVRNVKFHSTTSNEDHFFKKPLHKLRGLRVFACPICSKKCSTKKYLRSHLNTHNAERAFPCSYCSKTFLWESSLRGHERTHTGPLPFSCESCGKGFVCASKLKSHENSHIIDRSYSCEDCGKTFKWEKTLKAHSCRTMAADTLEAHTLGTL